MSPQILGFRSSGEEEPKVVLQHLSLGQLAPDANVDASSSYGSDREEELEELPHYQRKTIMGFVGYIQGIAQTMVDAPFNLEMSELRVWGLSAQADILGSNYQRWGSADSIEKAAECRRQALSLTPEGHATRAYQLAALGTTLSQKFGRQGDIADINKAIQCLSQATQLTPDGSSSKPVRQNNTGCAYLRRFELTGRLSDLDKAMEFCTLAVQLTPDGHSEKPNWLNNLGSTYVRRFMRIGELADVDKAIECQTKAVQLSPDGHPDKPIQLDYLGYSYMRRFERIGELADIDRAIGCQTQAVQLTPDDHQEKPSWLNDLGSSYMRRFERIGEITDLDKGIECHAQAVQLTPNDHPEKPGRLSNLGTSYKVRFQRIGELSDVDKAMDYQSQAVQLTPDGHPGKPNWLNNLGTSYICRFKHIGELADVEKAVECQSLAVQLTPDGHPDKSIQLVNLGTLYLCRFKRIGEIGDVDKAIECHIQAVQLTPDGHSEKPRSLSTLGNSYRHRFLRIGEVEDVHKAVEYQTRAVELAPDGHSDKPFLLNNLGSSYSCRSERIGEFADAEKAMECYTQAVQLTPDDYPEKPIWLNNLGNTYRRRFERHGQLVDLETAISCETKAVQLTPNGHADKPLWLGNLGNSYHLRFKCVGRLADLDKGMECLSQALQLTPSEHPTKPGWLHSLGYSYMSRFERIGNIPDLICAKNAFQQGAQLTVTSPETQLGCARNWAKASSLLGLSPQEAYQRCMDLVTHLIWLGTTIDHRYALLPNVRDLATEAASWAISVQSFDLAIEWLEQGRSIVWNQVLQLRTPFDDLFDADPILAQRLKNIAHQLESATSRQSGSEPSLDSEFPLEKVAQHHRRLAADWEQCLKEARSISGFQSFMRPRKAAELKTSATDGPVVIINTHSKRWDALVIFPHCDEVAHVPLGMMVPNAPGSSHAHPSFGAVPEQRGERPGGFVKKGQKPVDERKATLAALWSVVVKPILDALACTRKLSPDELPHVTWCATGGLAFAPLHAAGPYDGSSPNAFDLVISSYTPSLNALLASTPLVTQPDDGLLVIGQQYTEGCSPLPYTVYELEVIQSHAKTTRYRQLDSQNATVNAVLSAMDEHSWVHLACHATQNPVNPAKSAFHLHDGNLTLECITKRQFKNKGLAFLSACQTAKGDGEVPDEAVHLAAGILMAGYPSVIATMWSIYDEDGPEVAGRVYAELLKDGKMDYRGAARALHKAISELRQNIGDESFDRWVPFIHIGV